jgi:small subunit ribosomal protein S21
MTTFVKARPGDPADVVIRKFKKKVQMDGILTELKKRERYKKPSELKKERFAPYRKRKRRHRKAKRIKGGQ